MKIVLSYSITSAEEIRGIIFLIAFVQLGISILVSTLAWLMCGTRKEKFLRIFAFSFLTGLFIGLISGKLYDKYSYSILRGFYGMLFCIGPVLGAIAAFWIKRKKEKQKSDSSKKYKMKIELQSEEQLPEAAKSFLANFPSSKVFAFHGELGAGKTTFIKAICSQLGVKDAMSSPSFSIVNEYRDEKNNPVYHFDLYRLKSAAEAMDIGIEEYLYSGNYCFIEWPELIEEILPEETVHLNMCVEDGKRIVSIDF